jgi:hypothetical protein
MQLTGSFMNRRWIIHASVPMSTLVLALLLLGCGKTSSSTHTVASN